MLFTLTPRKLALVLGVIGLALFGAVGLTPRSATPEVAASSLPASCYGLEVVDLNLDPNANGSGASELIIGTPGDDTISAGAGNDCVDGGGGNDTIFLGAGHDVGIGGGGYDRVYGDSGIDRCDGERESSCEGNP